MWKAKNIGVSILCLLTYYVWYQHYHIFAMNQFHDTRELLALRISPKRQQKEESEEVLRLGPACCDNRMNSPSSQAYTQHLCS